MDADLAWSHLRVTDPDPAGHAIPGAARFIGSLGFSVNATRDAFNLLNSRASAIDHLYVSPLPGEPASGVEDLHTHPTLPRTLRVVLRMRF